MPIITFHSSAVTGITERRLCLRSVISRSREFSLTSFKKNLGKFLNSPHINGYKFLCQVCGIDIILSTYFDNTYVFYRSDRRRLNLPFSLLAGFWQLDSCVHHPNILLSYQVHIVVAKTMFVALILKASMPFRTPFFSNALFVNHCNIFELPL